MFGVCYILESVTYLEYDVTICVLQCLNNNVLYYYEFVVAMLSEFELSAYTCYK